MSGGPHCHGDDLDLQQALQQGSLAAAENEELQARTSSSSTAQDVDSPGPGAAGHAEGLAPPPVATSRGAPRQNRSCKISVEVALAICQAQPTGQHTRSDGVSRALANLYGITPKAVRDIWNGRTWARVTGRSRQQAGDVPWNAGTGTAQMGAGIVGSAMASPVVAMGHHAATQGTPERLHLLPRPQPISTGALAGAGAGAMGLSRNPVQDASGAFSFRPNLVEHPDGAIGFHDARGGRNHWHTGPSSSRRAQDGLRMSADTNGPAGIWDVPTMQPHSLPAMGHAQGHTGTARNLVGRHSSALEHYTTPHVGGESSLAPAPLSQAQYAAAAPAMVQQNRDLRIHGLPDTTANFLAPSRVDDGEMVNFYSGPRARPSDAQASASLPNPGNRTRDLVSLQDRLQRPGPTPMPGDGAHMKMMDGPSRSPGPVQWADDRGLDTTWNDESTAQGAMNTEDADSGSSSGSGSVVDFPPFTFGQVLRTLSDRPLPPDFNGRDEGEADEETEAAEEVKHAEADDGKSGMGRR